jgi:general secretion pathway protein H
MQALTRSNTAAGFFGRRRACFEENSHACPPRPCSGGFTVIELLVVIVILGIVAGMVTLSVAPSEQRRLTEELDRLAALFRLAHDEARISGRAITWQAGADGYRFVVSDDERDASEPDDPLRPRTWPFEVQAVDAPEIVFGREALMSPVRVEIVTPTRVVIMDIDAFGELTVAQ